MRLIGNFDKDHLAHRFSLFLKKEKIEHSLELEQGKSSPIFSIWIHNEDDMSRATKFYQEFCQNPHEARFDAMLMEVPSSPSEEDFSEQQKQQPTSSIIGFPKRKYPYKLSAIFFGICLAIFLIDWLQSIQMQANKDGKGYVLFTPVEGLFLFDLPKSIIELNTVLQRYDVDPMLPMSKQPPQVQEEINKLDTMPYWRGLSEMVLIKHRYPNAPPDYYTGPLFEKIRKGQIWRFVSPCFLHGNFLHILFNMIWLWILGVHIESRLKMWRYLLLVLIVGIISNTAQYVMSGAFFVGYSGIIMGMAGFTWMRQKVAPWEGYPLPKTTIIFLAIFVIAMFALEFFSFGLQVVGVQKFAPKIANTAHIVGAIVGILLARIPYFSWRTVER